MNFKDKLTYHILNKFSNLTEKLSQNTRDKLATQLAAFFYYFIPIRKKQALDNIKKAFPDKESRWINNQFSPA